VIGRSGVNLEAPAARFPRFRILYNTSATLLRFVWFFFNFIFIIFLFVYFFIFVSNDDTRTNDTL